MAQWSTIGPQNYGSQSMVHSPWSMVHGPWSIVHGHIYSYVYIYTNVWPIGQKKDHRIMVPNTWSIVHSPWSMVHSP